MSAPWRTDKSLSAVEFATLRRRVIFDSCKWDPQVGDACSLCDFPLILTATTWQELAGLAEGLGQETLRAETELLGSPALHCELGLPRALRMAMNEQPPTSVTEHHEPRVMRFDFHYTRAGWRISEVNSDVPGGFIEASAFTQLFADLYPGTKLTADPAAVYVDAVEQMANDCQNVAMIHATSYVDDRQVMIYLARLLAERGVRGYLASPADVQWRGGRAWVAEGTNLHAVDGIVRFFPAEWLPNLDRRTGWKHFFCGSRTPLSNPGTAILTQSKRFPLVWDRLDARLPLWRICLPETRDPRSAPWRRDEQWILKPALGRVGESIGIRGVTSAKDWRSISTNARWWPSYWIAQKRFDAIPVYHGQRPLYPVLGVYVIQGRASGVYGRLAQRPLIDYQAQDIAVLVESETGEQCE